MVGNEERFFFFLKLSAMFTERSAQVPVNQLGDGGPEAFTKRGAQLEEVLRRLGLEELLEDMPCHIPTSWDGTELGDFSLVVWT